MSEFLLRPSVRPLIEEVRSPEGWTAMLLRQQLPVASDAEITAYREAVNAVLERLPAFAEVHPEEVFFEFARCRPEKEVKTMRENARWWMPDFGVGVWLNQAAPATWTREEFEAAAPGTLRPVVDRVVRVSREVSAQASAWRLLLGSGALLRVSTTVADTFLKEATEMLLPTISDASLTSFPFYIPLLRAAALMARSTTYDQPLTEHLPAVNAYLRESVEDGGLLVVLRQSPEIFWNNFLRTPLNMDVVRITSREA